MLDLGGDKFRKTSGTLMNQGRWSETDAVRLPDYLR